MRFDGHGRRAHIFFMKIKILTVVVFLFSFPAWSQDDQARALLKKMLDACDDVRSAKFILNSTERELNGKMERSEIIIKMQTAPLKIYLYMIHPNPGAECLWKKDESNNRVLVNPNGFPYINLKLSPYNSLLRQDSHHLIPEIGFNHIASMTKYYMIKMRDSFFSYLQLTDTLLWDNRTCYELTFDFTSFQYVDYTVKMNETLTSIAAQFHLSDFVLLRSLAVGIQVPHVLKQVDGAHALRPQYGGGHHFGTNLGGPTECFHYRAIYL